MPIITIQRLPKNISEKRLEILRDAIIARVESILELGLAGKDAVTVLFPDDRLKRGSRKKIIADVAIFSRPERTEEVLAKLAEKVGTLLNSNFPNAKIECFIHPLERASGFWKIDPRPKQLTEVHHG